ncbi:MAG: hypothetical protein J5518_07180 [Lachnospiraceae bacterium]|nr:hypothetical protein [Lachnospiraceae bacterium]
MDAGYREYTSRREMKKKARQAKLLLILALFLLALIIGLFSVHAYAYAKNNEPERVKQYRSITIYAGDSLYSISTTYMTPEYADTASYVKEVAFMNHMDPDAKLIPGNHLIIPYYPEAE